MPAPSVFSTKSPRLSVRRRRSWSWAHRRRSSPSSDACTSMIALSSAGCLEWKRSNVYPTASLPPTCSTISTTGLTSNESSAAPHSSHTSDAACRCCDDSIRNHDFRLVKPWHENSCDWGFNEQIRAQTGEPIGRDWQTWSAAMFVYACECVATRSTPYFGESLVMPAPGATRVEI